MVYCTAMAMGPKFVCISRNSETHTHTETPFSLELKFEVNWHTVA